MRILASLLLVASMAATTRADDAGDVSKALDKQIAADSKVLADDAPLVSSNHMMGGAMIGAAWNVWELLGPPSSTINAGKPKDKKIAIAADGKSAWATFNVDVSNGSIKDKYRVSDVLVKTKTGWQVAVTSWSLPVANATANKEAKAGEIELSPFETKSEDEKLAAAFTKLTTDGLDTAASARKDLVAIGSGPGERTTGGAALAKAWKAAWVKKTTTSSIVARVLPSGNTGWVAATVSLEKKDYKIPFVVFAVFDKAPSGEWTLVHIHFSV